MNITHLYNKSSTSLKIKDILDSFERSVSIDVSETTSLEHSNVYIVELGSIDKVLSSKLLELFEKHQNPLIYFLINKEYNLMLFQTAFLLKAKNVITKNQDTQKIIKKIKSDLEIHEHQYIQSVLGKSLLQTQHFMFYKNKKLFYVSKKLLEDFKCQSYAQVEQEVVHQLSIEKLLAKDILVEKPITNKHQEGVSYSVRSSTTHKSEKIIYLEPFIEKKSFDNKLSFISNRLAFIELLKDKLIEKSISKKSFSIMTIEIENIKKLQKDLNEEALEELLKEFLLQVEIILDKKIILAQYDKDFYIALFEDIDFETLKLKARSFHNQTAEFIKNQKYSPIIGLFVYEIDTDKLNGVLSTLRSIHSRTLSQEDIQNNIQYINQIQDDMDSNQVLSISLDTAFTNGMEFKLLNIYKGLCINTSSKIIKKKDDLIYVKVELLQGIVMKNERETVLQSSGFIKDIKATVKYVDLDKKIAILEKFEFLNTNANARKYSRVTCSTRTPIVVSHPSGTINGDILDISVNSIAIQAKYRDMMEKIKQKDVTLTFVLPTSNNIDGFIKLNLRAKTVYILCEDYKCKIVFDLYKDESNEAVFMEYVYNRQKEIIAEVKKMSKVL